MSCTLYLHVRRTLETFAQHRPCIGLRQPFLCQLCAWQLVCCEVVGRGEAGRRSFHSFVETLPTEFLHRHSPFMPFDPRIPGYLHISLATLAI